MRKKIAILIILIFTMSLLSCTKEEKVEINISVAASLVEPMNKIIEEYKKENNIEINMNSGGSGTLKKQISQGADIGIFFSANEKYIDELIEEKLVLKEEKLNPVGNSLVLIKSNISKEKVNEISDLGNIKGKIAVGEVSTVPAGEYAKEALVNINLWESIKDNIVYCKSVSAVKTYVEKGEVDYGFVYKSDAIDLKNSSVVSEVLEKYHSNISYSLAPIYGYKYKEECELFIEFINSPKGKSILEKYGFKITI